MGNPFAKPRRQRVDTTTRKKVYQAQDSFVHTLVETTDNADGKTKDGDTDSVGPGMLSTSPRPPPPPLALEAPFPTTEIHDHVVTLVMVYYVGLTEEKTGKLVYFTLAWWRAKSST